MGSKLFFSLSSIKPQRNEEGGSQTTVTIDEMPGLVNISFLTLKLNKGGSLEPIWHTNANKIGYCHQGHALVSMRTPSGVETFTLKPGEFFFVPQGYIHHIVNIGEQEAAISFALNHVKPQTMCLSKAIYSLSNEVFRATFNTSSDFFDGLTKSKQEALIKTISPMQQTPSFIANRFKFDVGASKKAILTKGGYLELAIKPNLPVLDGLGLLTFGLNPKGVVEPHWHTNAGELIYIVKGHTRITVLSPDGKIETLDVKGGEGAFAPASYFHNIENVGTENVEVLAYFSHAEPDYIGIGEVMGGYSNEILGSVFNVSPNYFDPFKKPQGPLVIVPV